MNALRAWAGQVDRALADLYPGYFALVMATGVLSTSALRFHLRAVSQALLWIACAAGLVLATLYALRLARHAARMVGDLRDPRLTFAFSTFVAACDVVAARLVPEGAAGVAEGLVAIALAAWLALGYGAWTALFLSRAKPSLDVVNGGWLIFVVATQSLAVALSALAPHTSREADLRSLAFGFWAVGVGWYGVVIALVVARLLFRPSAPHEVAPPYWINMGATAISTVAGSALVPGAPAAPAIAAARPAVYATTLGLWAWGTWWIPLLFAMGVWKHGVHREPLRYEPTVWSLVFPWGMYSVATSEVARLTGLDALEGLARLAFFAAAAAWLAAAAGLVAALAAGAGVLRREVAR